MPRNGYFLAAIASLTLAITAWPAGAQAASQPSPPFTECPAIGQSPSCEVLLVVNPNNTVSVDVNPSVGPFDGDDDTLVGILNKSYQKVHAVTVSGPGSDLSGFDGDGICSGDYGDWDGSAGCPYGPTGYEGPGTSFVTSLLTPDSAQVDFADGLAPGKSAYFSLESNLTSAVLTAVKGVGSFGVFGKLPVEKSESQDTSAQAPPGSQCGRVKLAKDRAEGYTLAAGMFLRGYFDAAGLLKHFLDNTGTPIDITTGQITRDLEGNSQFVSLDNAVQGYILQQLKMGHDNIILNQPILRRIGLYQPNDLYYAFAGTQGLIVTGSGSLVGVDYAGTLTYEIDDSYGFTSLDHFDGYGDDMRYLQTVCGSEGGAHWFPDSITVTVPFSLPAT